MPLRELSPRAVPARLAAAFDRFLSPGVLRMTISFELFYNRSMPIVSTFFGILIRLFHDDHNPPHFHAEYGEFSAVFEIASGRLMGGRLPSRARRLVEEWRRAHVPELKAAWQSVSEGKLPQRIKPLE
jgi:hypothetical protein